MALIPTASILTWFSRLIETGYGVAALAADQFRRAGETNKVLFDVDPTFEMDTTNAGSDEPTGAFLTTNIFRETALEMFFAFQDIGIWLQMIFGNVSKNGSAVPYTHTFTALNKAVSRQHPTRTAGQRVGSDIFIYPGIGIRQLKIAKDKTGRLKVTITPHGKGIALKNPASYAVPAVVSDRIFGYNNQANQRFQDLIAAADKTYQCEVESWEWTFDNEPYGDGFRDCSPNLITNNPNSGQVKSEHLTGEYKWMFNARVRLDSTDPARKMMTDGNFVTVTTTITSPVTMNASGNPTLTISDPNMRVMKITDEPEEKGFVMRNIEAMCFARSSDGLMATTAVLINDVPSYSA